MSIEVPWGPIGHITYKRTYARKLDELDPNSAIENYEDTVDRVIKACDVQLNVGFTDEENTRAKEIFMKLKGTVAGRFMWQLGTQTVDRLGLFSLQNCFSSDTEFMTNRGIKSFDDFNDGDIVEVRGRDKWLPATIKEFGKQPIVELIVNKGRREQTIRTTMNHRWILKDNSIAVTESLNIGDKLKHLRKRTNFHRIFTCPIGIQHGLVFGDGNYNNNAKSCCITICGDSINETRSFFGGPRSESREITGLPSNWKQLPDIDMNKHYLYGFLAGWFAADGSIGMNGSNITLASKSKEQLMWAKSAFSMLCVTTSNVTLSRELSPFDGSYKPLYRVTIDRENLPKEFFLLSKHSERFKELKSPLDWTVKSINFTNNEESVFCVVEPENEEFTLASGILTKNCAFIVVDKPVEPFTWAMDALMLGSGVGFNIQREYVYELPKVKSKIDIVRKDTKDADFIVPDSREGWVLLLKKTLEAHFLTGEGFSYSTVCIRGAGVAIKGFGGTASGPEILCEGIQHIHKLLNERALKKARPIDCLDIMNIIGSIVVAGNVRRSAQIALGDMDDLQFLDAKRWDLGNIPNWRAMSNNSVICNDMSQIPDQFWEGYKGNGEPYGLINLKLAKTIGRTGETQYPDEEVAGVNPCFSPETLITTDRGLFPIEQLVGETVKVLSNGEWVTVSNFRVTGENKKILKITMQDGAELRVTENHSIILEDGSRVEAKDIVEGVSLKLSNYTSHGEINSKGAYLKGFLCGDGTSVLDRPLLYLYEPKYGCEGRLIESAMEISNGDINTSCVEILDFVDQISKGKSRKAMRGLTPKKQELTQWCRENKQRLPLDCFQWDEDSKLEFIAGLFDSDGTASDTTNGFLYQLTSIGEDFLKDVQTLLKTIGVYSKLSLGNKGGYRNFNDGYGDYECKSTFRLTISQESSITLSSKVNFSRLVSFVDKNTVYKIVPKRKTIVSIEDDGIEELVYCCTIPETHSLTIGIGLEVGQCAEQFLASAETCCLAEVHLPNIESEDELKEVCTYLYRINKHSLRLKCHHKETEEIVHKNMRMGIGITGYAMATKKQKSWLDGAYKHLRQYDVDYSAVRGWPVSIKLTTVKPSGTLSLLSGVTPGAHPGYSHYFIRRIRISTSSDLIAVCKNAGYDVEFVRKYDGTDDKTTMVVSFPCKFPKHTKVASDCTAIDQLEVIKELQSNWSDNAVSCTIYYKMEELDGIKLWLKENFNTSIKSVSFLLHSEHGFDQAPYEEITKEEYIAMSKETTPITSFEVSEDDISADQIGCAGGACPIK